MHLFSLLPWLNVFNHVETEFADFLCDREALE